MIDKLLNQDGADSMSTLLEAWRSRQPLPKDTIILLMREFTLKCLASAYRRLDLKEEEIDQLLKGGRLTLERVGRYTQPNYRPVAGLTPFFKRFVENSSPRRGRWSQSLRLGRY